MDLTSAAKRLNRMEARLTRQGTDNRAPWGGPGWLEQLQVLAQDVLSIKRAAEQVGDYRNALAAVQTLCRIVELRAKLSGDFKETTPINVVNLQLNPVTALRMAETYLSRHRTLEPK